MSERPPRVFLSVGTKQSKEQEQFIAALQLLLSNAGFEMRRAQWSAINPLAKIKEEMNGCDGAVMVAFERIYAKEGRERSSSTKFTRITDQRSRSGNPPRPCGHGLLVYRQGPLRSYNAKRGRRFSGPFRRTPGSRA